MTPLIVVESLVILLLAILVAGLLKSHAEILRQLNALGVGEDGSIVPAAGSVRPRTTGFEKAPTSTLVGDDLSGAAISLSLEHRKGSTLLAFLSSGCESCQGFWKEFRGDFDLPAPDTRTIIITKGPSSESPSRLRELAPANLPVLLSDEMWDVFRVPMTPYFLLVDGDGSVVGEGAASTWHHLLGLLRQSAADAQSTPVRLDTDGRQHFTDSNLKESGVEPGDPSLYQNPIDHQ